jgi:hypothetical protein
MSRQEVQGHAQPETTAMDGGREAQHHRRSASDIADDQRGVPATRHRPGPVLRLGEASAERGPDSVTGQASGAEAELETEVTRLRAVVAELSAENLELKKGRWP